jgi:hypothetical protein
MSRLWFRTRCQSPLRVGLPNSLHRCGLKPYHGRPETVKDSFDACLVLGRTDGVAIMNKWVRRALGLAVVAAGAFAIRVLAPEDRASWWWASYAAVILLLVAVSLARRNNAQTAKGARAIGSVLLVAPFMLIALLIPKAFDLAKETPGTCDSMPVSPTTEDLKGATLTFNTLKIRDPAATKISLGNSMGSAKVPIMLDVQSAQPVPPNQPPTQTPVPKSIKLDEVSLLRRGTDPDVGVAVKAGAEFTSSVAGRVWICVVRASGASGTPGAFGLDPGEYSGSVTIVDPRLPTTTIPFTFTVAYPNWAVVAMSLCITVAAGGAFIAIARKEPVGEGQVGFKEVASFLGTWAGFVAFFVGAGAAVVAYVSTYLNNNAWGAATVEWLSMVAAMFTAFVASATAFRFARVLSDTPAGSAGGSGTAGSGTAGSGTAGSGTAGSGTAGSRVAG